MRDTFQALSTGLIRRRSKKIMAHNTCERCGAFATVGVKRAPRNRDGLTLVTSEHHYCRPCATAMGVPTPPREASIGEPAPPTWREIELIVAHYEDSLRDDPSLRDHVLSLAQALEEQVASVPGPMPDAVAAALARLRAS